MADMTVQPGSSGSRIHEPIVGGTKNAESAMSVPNSMDVIEIQRHLPHRYPFLLIDRVHDYKAYDFIKGCKAVSVCEPILQGHFPGNPVMPGVLMIEALAQASAILGKVSKGEACDTCLLTEVTESRFRRMVVPGDVLELDVKLLKSRKDFFWFSGEASVNGEMAAIAKFTAKLA
ncbi:3-hydroxyacyl-ACP dehydratase FabZ [Pseudobacteriovorax antillogorgiicola]|uniref:3-hydroxyacyl-[acyl-carrier-protein] dehydratase n=1 Tax=Pseudobacteriovorax antillogorgiicola TaxID=1513793 RepID=A0A1Y6BEB5_9BACT|nr:3-hydroxyacyl-ACP dehydratase FabZ [Pseudobacteriovorax antillogorgiicola]TCS57583.1 3-hydroxyacyl-[acyl-carrier-protein] dehydratase [Pseudobacteriovorax antillogorgiicola]SME99588.1 3-hydroxyacyl-[acyl-carrier-protein] dehydratase [Pseudobacteriovorax antillogorgiicola]